MSEPIVAPIQRWQGKHYSGRLVYKGRESGDWYWQCDLHSEEPVPDDQWGVFRTQHWAFIAALTHTLTCPYRAAKEPV